MCRKSKLTKFHHDLNSNAEIDEDSKLYNAAIILQKKLKEIPKLNLPWPPLAYEFKMMMYKK